MNEEATAKLKDIEEKFERSKRDPKQFPALRALSPAAMFQRRVLVYRGPAAKLEFVSFDLPAPAHQLRSDDRTPWLTTTWNMQWEAGPYRAIDTDELSPTLSFLRDLQTTTSPPTSDIVLVPNEPDNIYQAWAPLYHLLPRRRLVRHGLPLIHRGMWPRQGYCFAEDRIAPSQRGSLERAFAEHLWSVGLGRAKTPLIGFSESDPLKLLAYDLSFWRSLLEQLVREYCGELGRVPRSKDDDDPESLPTKHPSLTYEMPCSGTELWTGEAEANDVARDLMELADERFNLRDVMEAIRSNRVEEDFSARWSAEREDFERKLYRKRSKVKVSFVEIDDAVPCLDHDAELDGDMLYRNLMSVVDPKERRVIVCMSRGVTGVREIAKRLGYANHSPVSKALASIRQKARRMLD